MSPAYYSQMPPIKRILEKRGSVEYLYLKMKAFAKIKVFGKT